MNKRELCAHVAEAASLSRAEADAAVSAVFSAVADALAAGETVAIAGFRHLRHQTPRGQAGTQSAHRGAHRHPRLGRARVQARQGPPQGGEVVHRPMTESP